MRCKQRNNIAVMNMLCIQCKLQIKENAGNCKRSRSYGSDNRRVRREHSNAPSGIGNSGCAYVHCHNSLGGFYEGNIQAIWRHYDSRLCDSSVSGAYGKYFSGTGRHACADDICVGQWRNIKDQRHERQVCEWQIYGE